MKYRKKPVVIEAIKWTGSNTDEVLGFTGENAFEGNHMVNETTPLERVLRVKTIEGKLTARIGDYIIKGVQGEFYPCKSDIFEATYEKVEGE